MQWSVRVSMGYLSLLFPHRKWNRNQFDSFSPLQRCLKKIHKWQARTTVNKTELNSFSESPFLLGTTAHQKIPKELLPALPPGWLVFQTVSDFKPTFYSSSPPPPKQPQCNEKSKQLLLCLARLKRFQPLVSCTFLPWEAAIGLDLFFPSRHHRHPRVACTRWLRTAFSAPSP